MSTNTIEVAKLGADLKSLNSYLTTRSYLTGYAPTSDDAACCAAIGAASPDKAQFANAARWFKHISSFSAAERTAFPAGKGSVTVQAEPASKKKEAAPSPKKEAAPTKPVAVEEEEEDDDLFGSDTEEDRAHEAALKAKAAAARAGKPEKEKPKGRSLIVLEIKPYEVETDLNAMAVEIKKLEHAGIQNWGAEHKLLPVAYGIMKLAISLVVFDDDIDTETIEEMIMAVYPEDIQSIDVAAMSKV
jgi:elongation factor 1-beta